MPKLAGFTIRLDILKPQGERQKLISQVFRWLLSAGRYLIIFVEVLVLVAFLLRFKLDADIASTKQAIDEQIPFLESLKSDEKIIRNLQFQIATIKDIHQNSPDYSLILQKIAQQTPTAVVISGINLEKTQSGLVSMKIVGKAISGDHLNTLNLGLKSDNNFQNIILSGVSFEQGIISFTITGSFKNVEGQRS